MRSVPTTYTKLREALLNDVFPEERYWIDFKRQLYPVQPAGQTPRKAERRHAHDELARDMASMAIRGGYLVYGVAEDKQAHTFDPVEMELPAGLRETVDSIARDKITPALMVEPSLLIGDATTVPQGFMVIEVPESPDAPHMVNGMYYGRSDTGRIVLQDHDVERLIVLRNRQFDRLQEQVELTFASDPIKPEERQVPHLYLTAAPTRPSPDMFLSCTRDSNAAARLMQLCVDVVNVDRKRQNRRKGDVRETLAEWFHTRRGSRSPTMWLDSPMVEAGKEGGDAPSGLTTVVA